METIVEAFGEMQKDLNEERRAAERKWAKREKQLQRVIGSTSGMYGDLQGLIGSSLQTIPALVEPGGQPAAGAMMLAQDEAIGCSRASTEKILKPGESGSAYQIEPAEDENDQKVFSLTDFSRSGMAAKHQRG